MNCLRVWGALLVLAYCVDANAFLEPLLDDGEWTGETGFQYRYFKDPGDFGQTQNDLALRLQGQYDSRWNDDNDSFTFVPYLLLDKQDDKRTHADIREALWIHVGDDWELRSGVTRVFWGRTEFTNVVDVINQTDLVDGDDEKLGQPMINLSVVHDWGIFDFYWLVGFRERTFPGEDGRLRTPLVVDTDHPVYLKNASPHSLDFAFRWQRPVTDELDMALSLFSGVDREPSFSFNFDFADPKLVPYYSHKDQVGLELEYIHDSIALKFEGIDVRSVVENYDSAVVGFEYTFNSIFQSDIDMTFITEYMWDSRNQTAPGFMEHDLGLGTRFTFNDEFDTSILAGVLWDNQTDEKLASIEGERRIGEHFKLKVQARVVMDRGQPELGQTTWQILQDLSNSNLLNSNLVSQSFLLDYLYGLIKDNGLSILYQNEGFVPTLQQLQRLAEANRKLSLLDSDSYAQVELTYYY